MRLKSVLSAAVLAGAFCVTVSGAIAGPIILGPTMPNTLPKALAIPLNTTQPIHVQLLNGYRQVREFWLSRAIVR